MVHLAAGAKLAGQLLVALKSPAFVPVKVILEIFRFVVPLLVSVTVFATLGVLMTWLPNASEVGERLAAALVPVPVRVTVWVLPETPPLLSVMVNAPVSMPVAVGAKVTLIVQEPPLAMLPPQLLVWPKLALATMLLRVRVLPPVLLRIIGCELLVVPRF